MSTADPTKFKIAKTVRVKGIALCITLLPGTQRLVFGSSDFNVYELDLAADKPQPVEFTGDGHQSYVTGIARTADLKNESQFAPSMRTTNGFAM
jgi:WD40 repeat protein